MVDDIMLQAEERMERALASLGEAFGSVRTGRANALLLDRIKVDYYGVPTPVNQMAGVKTPEAHLLVIEPWDKGHAACHRARHPRERFGRRPRTTDGSVIRLPFPSLTEERRRDLVSSARPTPRKRAWPCATPRRDANTAIEKAVKNDNLPEDESKRARGRDPEDDRSVRCRVDEVLKKKEAEVMEI